MNNQQDMNDSLIIISRLGLKPHSNGKSFYGFGHFTYNKYFHGYLYSRMSITLIYLSDFPVFHEILIDSDLLQEKQWSVFVLKIIG